jgi:predicted metalloprotease
VWTKHATETKSAQGQALFNNVTDSDIQEALNAAAAVGDDAIQKKMGGGVDESKFTHGSSEQRQRWFNQGYSSGNAKTCDTFGNGV